MFPLIRDLIPHAYLYHDLASCEQASMTYKGHSGFHTKQTSLLSSKEVFRNISLFPTGNNTNVAHLTNAIIENVDCKTLRPTLTVRTLPFSGDAAVRRDALKPSVSKTNEFYSRENSAAGAPVRAFRGVTPGLRACKAPVQQRPTAPNIVKMAEGGMGQRLGSFYIVLLESDNAHAQQIWRHRN